MVGRAGDYKIVFVFFNPLALLLFLGFAGQDSSRDKHERVGRISFERRHGGPIWNPSKHRNTNSDEET